MTKAEESHPRGESQPSGAFSQPRPSWVAFSTMRTNSRWLRHSSGW
jgi:hypothetical protein